MDPNTISRPMPSSRRCRRFTNRPANEECLTEVNLAWSRCPLSVLTCRYGARLKPGVRAERSEIEVDVGTGLALRICAGASRNFLGPTADYVGEGVKVWGAAASREREPNISRPPKSFGPKLNFLEAFSRVLEGVVNNGSFCDDELGAEYRRSSGVVSQRKESRDDRGSALNASSWSHVHVPD